MVCGPVGIVHARQTPGFGVPDGLPFPTKSVVAMVRYWQRLSRVTKNWTFVGMHRTET